ncbi:hypothetical protein KY290_027030 [Solanum tuberosum]|uniref:Uncharacterized protein n=1 Tax=Solanum tuberosum TaxID=4113 RepID=A0ABQ7UDY4_SOLTU|nr:hypothetical protein KY284_025989 [Solanum tuberosum]KAH0747798.1 hypothetical protein KY290_027030 [Solanum tuberosum]
MSTPCYPCNNSGRTCKGCVLSPIFSAQNIEDFEWLDKLFEAKACLEHKIAKKEAKLEHIELRIAKSEAHRQWIKNRIAELKQCRTDLE